MARNRKNQSSGELFWPALKASVFCVVIVICCVGYVWQKKQIADLSQDIRFDEKKLAALRENNDKLRRQLGTLLSPPALEAKVRELKLGLVVAQQNQIWRLPEPGAAPAAQPVVLKREQQLAAGSVRAGMLP